MALRDEWKDTYPGIDQVIDKFRRAEARIHKECFQVRLDEIMLMLSDPEFSGVRWLTDRSAGMWASDADSSWTDMYGALVRLLFDVGFIGCATRAAAAPIFHMDDPLLLDSETTLERTDYFFVHRAYHLSLDIQSAQGQ